MITEDTRLNIRSGPAPEFRILGKAQSGTTLDVVGRTADGSWLQIVRSDLANGEGWVSAAYVDLASPVDDLPVVESAPVPAGRTASPASTPEPTRCTGNGYCGRRGNSSRAGRIPEPRDSDGPTSTGPSGLSGTLAFQDGRGSIYVYDLDTGAVRYLTNGFDPDISRDGSKVTFIRDVVGGLSIYSINLDGSNEEMLYKDGNIITSPKWSPEADKVVFSRFLGTYKCFDLSFFLGCISFYQLRLRYPDVPPQFLGKILNGADRLEFPNYGLTRITVDSDREFRDINALDSAESPDWNEDGIVYQSKAGLEITEDTPDGRTRSVFHGDWDWDPDWAPNGGRIIFQSKEGPHWEIWSVNPDGGDLFALTRPVTTLVDQLPSNVAPAFSPDGQQIVYLSNRAEDNDAGPWRFWVMDAGGGNQRPLPLDMTVDYGFSGEQMVSWGP